MIFMRKIRAKLKAQLKLKAVLKGYIVRKLIMKSLGVRTIIKEIKSIKDKMKEGTNKFIVSQLKKQLKIKVEKLIEKVNLLSK